MSHTRALITLIRTAPSGIPEAHLLGGAISHQLTTEAKQRRKDGGDFAEKPEGGRWGVKGRAH